MPISKNALVLAWACVWYLGAQIAPAKTNTP
jgi:hypothetical protein